MSREGSDVMTPSPEPAMPPPGPEAAGPAGSLARLVGAHSPGSVTALFALCSALPVSLVVPRAAIMPLALRPTALLARGWWGLRGDPAARPDALLLALAGLALGTLALA